MTAERNGGGLTQRKIPEWMSRTGARILDDEMRIILAPGSPTVRAGTTVTLTNRDDIAHTVTSTTKPVKSKPRDTDNNKLSFTFATSDSYAYFRSLHPHMTAKTVVEATTGSSGDP